MTLEAPNELFKPFVFGFRRTQSTFLLRSGAEEHRLKFSETFLRWTEVERHWPRLLAAFKLPRTIPRTEGSYRGRMSLSQPVEDGFLDK